MNERFFELDVLAVVCNVLQLMFMTPMQRNEHGPLGTTRHKRTGKPIFGEVPYLRNTNTSIGHQHNFRKLQASPVLVEGFGPPNDGFPFDSP